uniref:Protein C10 n=1 Tax=Noctiluca scintillans TaxID=2966 RepID=A0A7S1F3W4_NOCSC
MAAAAPQLNKEQAKQLLDEAFAIIDTPDNRNTLKDAVLKAVDENPDDEMKQQFAKTQLLTPLVQGMVAPVYEKFGFNVQTSMMAIMQIQMHSMGDEDMTNKIKKLMMGLQGKFEVFENM